MVLVEQWYFASRVGGSGFQCLILSWPRLSESSQSLPRWPNGLPTARQQALVDGLIGECRDGGCSGAKHSEVGFIFLV